MTYELFTALVTFAFATVISPGPNNLMLMASGANFGFTRSIPHMLGIILGFPAMIVLVGLGVTRLFDLWPTSYLILKIASVIYLLYLAWKIATTDTIGRADSSSKPFTFLQAAAFQWVNPKAWSMALSAITIFAPDRSITGVLWVACTYVALAVFSTSTWVFLGQEVRRFLSEPGRLRIFNIIMAMLLIASLALVFIGETSAS